MSAEYGIRATEVSDIFGKRGRQELQSLLGALPAPTAFATSRLLKQADGLNQDIQALEQPMAELFEVDDVIRLLMTLPGVGFILATVIRTEIGDVKRFAHHEQLAAYAGTIPRVHESGGHRRYGPLR
jgi:transposase